MNRAIEMLHEATTPGGILASPNLQDNYQRVWARDGIMSGIAGILIGDVKIVEGLKNTCLTLAKNQHPKGTIPSNVPLDGSPPSYGSLVGRVDATSWFIIGSCLYYLNQKDDHFWEYVEPSVMTALHILDTWEYNDRHLIYTPLSGNWADEYPLHGYLLYDNLLRLWAVRLLAKVLGQNNLERKEESILQAIRYNFIFDNTNHTRYHSSLYRRSFDSSWKIPLAGFNPGRYYKIFDACAVGMALLLDVFEDDELVNNIHNYLTKMPFNENSNLIIPAFWPVINKKAKLWAELAENYSFDFKNKPYHFHNGGIWPIMTGWLNLGLKSQQQTEIVLNINSSLLSLIEKDQYRFSEYFDSKNLEPYGKRPLSYSATGFIFSHIASTTQDLHKLYTS